MWKLIDSMSEERQKAAFADEMATAGKETHWSRDRNLRDVLVYLYEWHQLLLRWIKAKLDGGYKTVLPEPYNWNTYPAMNVEFWKKHQSTPLTQAKANLKESHKEVMTLIGQFSNDELFVKGAFVGLDPKASHILKGMMREVCDAGGAIFFSTHVLEVAEKLCDKVAIIKGGKLIRSGTMEEVKGDDSLEEVFLELEGESC